MKTKMDTETLSLLRRIGLNQYESKVYVALLSAGPTSASDLSELAGIPRPRAYDVLSKLEKKGFVSTQPGRPTKFRAFDVKEAFITLKKKRQIDHSKELGEIDKIETQLSKKVSTTEYVETSGASDFVWVIKDRSNIYSKIQSLIDNASKSVVIATTPEGIKRKLDAYEDTLISAKKRGVNVKFISQTATKIKKSVGDFKTKDKLHRMMVIDDHVVLFLTPEGNAKSEVGAWINSPYLADNMRKMLV